MRHEKIPSWPGLASRDLGRRGFIQSGVTAGAGLMLGSQLGSPAWAKKDKDEDEHHACPAVPRPIPHITSPPGLHFFFPGPVDASPANSPNNGHDPSVITDFSGEIAQADLTFSGKGTDLKTGSSATYDFGADMRFMNGVFVGLDNEKHRGTIGAI